MRLLEVFLLMELNDRLNYIAQNMHKKILDRWVQHMEEAGIAGLPREWKDALHDETLPDPVNNDNWTEERALNAVKWIVEWFAQNDPTPNKKYTDWIIRQWLSEKLWLEDASKVRTMLETFDAHKKNLKKMDIPWVPRDGTGTIPPPERRGDLNSWKEYRVLARILRPLAGVQAAGEKVSNFLKKPEIQDYIHHPVPDPVKAFGRDGDFDFEDLQSNYVDENGDNNFDTMDWYGGFVNQPDEDATTAIKPIYKSDRLAVLQPNTRAAACELGRGTEWCTSATEAENYFWNYAPDSPLYVILTDKMGKFQFHFDSGQFANIHDDMLSDDELDKLVNAYPELMTIFEKDAIEHHQSALLNPDEWTPEKVEEYHAAGEHDDMLFKLIQVWEHRASEETLLALEAIAREASPLAAYSYVREPTVADYSKAIVLDAEATEGSGYASQSMLKILRHARDKGIKLPDEAIDIAIKTDSRSIKHASIEQLTRNPDWIINASVNDSTWFKIAAAYTHNLPADWSPAHDYLADPVNDLVMEVFRDHPQGRATLDALIKAKPQLVRYCLDYFGTDVWKRAYAYANAEPSTSGSPDHITAENNNMERMADTIRWKKMPNLDHADLAVYLLKNGILHRGTFLAIEKAMGGELPIEIQQALIKKSPTLISFMDNPHSRLEYEAHRDMENGGRAFRDKQAQQWKAENDAAAAHAAAGGDVWDSKSAATESITEGVSPILYHVSQIHNVRDMLTNNTIRLTPDFGTGAEKEHQPEGKIHYLSTARSKTGSYGYPVSKHQKNGAMVVFDGRALMAGGYTGKAVDYWGPEFRALGKDEMEDRIFSKKPTIPNASKYIKEIHILFDRDRTDDRNDHVARVLKDLGYKAKRLNVPLYIYTDQQAFALLNKNKAASVASVDAPADRLPLPGTDVEPRGWRGGPARNYFGGWIELLKVNDASQLSKVGKEALNRAHYHDANQGVDADIHNARTNSQRPHLDKFLAVLQQFKINSTTELMTYVNRKFNSTGW